MDDRTKMQVSYIGDAVAAAGFALTGARVHSPSPEPEAVWGLIMRERAISDLLIIDVDLAAVVAGRLRDALAEQPVPPVLVIPSPAGEAGYADSAMVAARRALGLS
jgi:vacuolar-type H+-ATPase subunit F/Vma7